MPSQSDEYKIIVSVQNAQQIDALNAKIKTSEETIRKLSTELNAGTRNQAEFAQAAEPIARNIARAQQEIKQLESATRELGMGGKNAAYGLMQLGHAVDDMQYGFNAVVNNIPGIVQGLTGSMGMAAGLGITAVAVNQLMNHWDELEAKLGNTAAFEIAKGALIQLREEAKKSLEGKDGFGWNLGNALPGNNQGVRIAEIAKMGGGDNAMKNALNALKEEKEREEAVKKANVDIEGVAGDEQEERAKAFARAMKKYGGGKKLLNDLFDQQAKAMGVVDPAARANLRDGITQQIAEAMKGENPNPGLMHGAFKKILDFEKVRPDMERLTKASEDAMNAEIKKNNAEDEQVRKFAQANQKDADIAAREDREMKAKRHRQDAWLKQLTDEGVREEEEKERLAEEEDRKKARGAHVREVRAKRNEIDATQDQIQALHKLPTSHSFGSGREYVMDLQKKALDNPVKKQIEIMEKQLDVQQKQLQAIQDKWALRFEQ